MEVFAPSSGQAQQLYTGVESHSHNRLKRSLRLNFRSSYGYKEWETDLLQDFPGSGNTASDKLRRVILRAGSNRSWTRVNQKVYVAFTEDQFVRSTQIAMSGYGSHGTFVHLYLNGVYEGLYNLVERPDDTFGEEYFGGDDEFWFFTNHGGAGSKDNTRWRVLLDEVAKEDLSVDSKYTEMQEYLDVQTFADYLILNFYLGMTDWPSNNWYVIVRNDDSEEGPAPAKYVSWDGELSLDYRLGRAREGSTILNEFLYLTFQADGIVKLWYALRANQDFMTMFYSRVAQHTGAGGALSVEKTIERWNALNDFVESAVIGESARWGDSLKSWGGQYDTTRTRDVDWVEEVERMRSLLQVNTQQFLDEIELLRKNTDGCRSFFGGFGCTWTRWLYAILDHFGWAGIWKDDR